MKRVFRQGRLAMWLAIATVLAILTFLPGRPSLAGPALPFNPALPGTFQVKTMTYGSGADLHRPEYGAQVGVTTETVDASALLGAWSGRDGEKRTKYWGFGAGSLPLNGRVWYPDGAGPFPLVLCVHGNHDMTAFSDPGYAYLGELMASRGYIFVSVDENFLNGSMKCGDFHGRENLVRAWLLLKHLEQWSKWNTGSNNPFTDRVDVSRIALIGHSRGGEAVATAAALNRLTRLPDDANFKLAFGFPIRTVIAIAPIDGQYRPANWPVSLVDVNYLVLQGSQDADVCFFAGARQYQRVRFTGNNYGMKAALYIEKANHGQFNTVWGRKDIPLPFGLLDTKAIMNGDDQRQIAKLYISAFLDATLRGERGLVPLFRDPRTAGNWLPATAYMSQFEDSNYLTVADFQEDMDPVTATVPGGRLEGDKLTVWRESGLWFRVWVSQENNAVYLGWKGPAGYSVTIPDGLTKQWGLSPESLLVFSMADGRPEYARGQKNPAPSNPLDFSVELTLNTGETSTVSLSQFGVVQGAFMSKFTRSKRLEKKFYANPSETVMQRYEIPLSAFGLDPSRIAQIRFVFNRSSEGIVILDDVGFRR